MPFALDQIIVSAATAWTTSSAMTVRRPVESQCRPRHGTSARPNTVAVKRSKPSASKETTSDTDSTVTVTEAVSEPPLPSPIVYVKASSPVVCRSGS